MANTIFLDHLYEEAINEDIPLPAITESNEAAMPQGMTKAD